MNAVTAAKLFNWRARIVFADDVDDLRLGEAALAHGGDLLRCPIGRKSTAIPGSRFRSDPTYEH